MLSTAWKAFQVQWRWLDVGKQIHDLIRVQPLSSIHTLRSDSLTESPARVVVSSSQNIFIQKLSEGGVPAQ